MSFFSLKRYPQKKAADHDKKYETWTIESSFSLEKEAEKAEKSVKAIKKGNESGMLSILRKYEIITKIATVSTADVKIPPLDKCLFLDTRGARKKTNMNRKKQKCCNFSGVGFFEKSPIR